MRIRKHSTHRHTHSIADLINGSQPTMLCLFDACCCCRRLGVGPECWNQALTEVTLLSLSPPPSLSLSVFCSHYSAHPRRDLISQCAVLCYAVPCRAVGRGACLALQRRGQARAEGVKVSRLQAEDKKGAPIPSTR